MNLQVVTKTISCIVVGAALLAVALLSAGIGRPDVRFVSTGAAVTAVLLTFIAITVNTYRNAALDRSMGRLLHDPDGAGSAARHNRPRR